MSKVTSQTEEFLESIYRLQERNGAARTSELVKMLKVVPGTVTNTVERLKRRGLVTHRAYKGVKLTKKGEKIALRVLRRHRLSECLLSDVLGMDWKKVHEAACNLEHGITEDIAQNIEKTLEQPQTCPHGNPIPTRNGVIQGETDVKKLTSLKPEEKGTVISITDETHRTLKFFAELGLKPGAHIKVIKTGTKSYPLTLKVGKANVNISAQLASTVKVKTTGVNEHVNQEVEK